MSTPSNNPYAHNPDDDSSASSDSGASPSDPASGAGGSATPGQFHQPSAGSSPYGQPTPYGQPQGSPYGQPSGSPMPYGGYDASQSGYQGQQPGYPNGMHTSSGMGWGADTSKNSLGGWALGTGIGGILCCGFASIAAIIVGVMGRKAADAGLATNKGLSTAGLALGIVGVGLWAIGLVVLFATGSGEVYWNTY